MLYIAVEVKKKKKKSIMSHKENKFYIKYANIKFIFAYN